MSKKNKLKLQLNKKITNNRTFSYQKGTVNLVFTLDVDNKTELENFREIMVQGLQDIDDRLTEI